MVNYTLLKFSFLSYIQLGFIILAGIAACVYFIFLCYMFFRVFRNISSKKSALPQMSQRRRKFYTVRYILRLLKTIIEPIHVFSE